MPSWKKVITSGSDASLASLFVANAVTSSIFSGSRYIGASFTGSFSGSVAAPGSNTNIIYNSSGILAGSTNFIFDGTNVGIGTTSPSSHLDIRGTADTAGQISLQVRSGNTSANFNSNQITFGYANTALYRHAIKTRHNDGSAPGNAIDFYTWRAGVDTTSTIGTQHVMSLNGANVGIGTTAPDRKLSVSGSIGAYVGNNEGAVSITVGEGTTGPTGNIISLETNSTSNTTRIYNTGTSTSLNIGSTGTTSDVSLSSVRDLYFKVNNGGDVFAGTTALYVSSSTNIGIGTTAPTAKLHVSGNTYIDGRASIATTSTAGTGLTVGGSSVFLSFGEFQQGNSLYFYSSGNTFNTALAQSGNLFTIGGSVYVSSSNNVGIGTSTLENIASTTTLTINGSTGGGATSYQVGGVRVGLANGNDNYFTLQSYNSRPLSLGYNNNNTVVINTSNNVGIGTTNPSQKLHVVGDSIFNGLKTIQLDRSVAAAVNSYTDIGSFNIGNGAHSMIISINASISGYSVAKSYIISDQYGGTAAAWTVAAPISDSGPYSDNFELLVNFSDATCSLRIRKSLGSTYTGTYSVTILYTGYTTATFTPSTSTGTDSTVYSILGSSLISQVDGVVGINRTVTQTGIRLDVSGAAAIAGGTEGIRLGSIGDNSAYDNVKIYYTGFNSSVPRVYLTPRTTPGSGIVNTYFHLLNSNGTSTTSNNTMGLLVDGSVGIGTTTPTAKLHVSSSTGGVFEIDGAGATTVLYVSASGNVGIGTITPGATLDVIGNVRATSFTGSFSGSVVAVGSNTQIIYNNAGVLAGSTNLVFNGSNVGIGSASPAFPLDVNGTVRVTTLIETSTKILKENIQPYSTDINKFKKLKPVSFNWKDTKKEDIGLIAEDLNKVFPEFVSKDNGKPVGIHYGKLAAIFINVIKEQQERIEALEKQVKKLIK
jgi:hypothetical protein